MKRWRAKLLLASGAAFLALAIPAAGQQGQEEEPESILPPGFGEPAPPPPAPPEGSAPGTPPAEDPGSPPAVPEPGVVASPAPGVPTIQNSAEEDLEALAQQQLPPPIEIPEESRRPTNVVGPLRAGNWGLGYDAFGNANGAFLAALMRRLDAPLPSRWESILLRRALLSEIPAPPQVNEVDWVAERAWLLLRMGEADAARALVQAIDVDRFTPRMFTVAVQVALATADPAGLCPLVGPGKEVSDEPVWPLAEAMCAALEGEAARASQLIDQARRRSGAGRADVVLAEKVIGAGTDTRRAVSVNWDEVDQLNSWRFGLASATGLLVPDRLMNRAGGQVWAWQARAPMVPLESRVNAAFRAAALGVFSHAALVEMFSLIADGTDASDLPDTLAGRLRQAYAAPSLDGRLRAMSGLWGEGDRFSRLILTATAAGGLPPSDAYGERTADIIASMFTAGLDARAGRWAPVVEAMGDDGDRAWALLAVGTPRPVVDISGKADDVIGRIGGHRGRMLAAALAGLGRLQDSAAYEVDTAPRTRWAGMIASAARNRQPGTVALLAAVGMQTGGWGGVPPAHFYQMIRALHEVGLDFEARMIAAEAMTRL
ncbi:MAG TPA: hypothetical protein VF727_08945 [Allosphingosinicella sp.]|jgi:hypothetical protein